MSTKKDIMIDEHAPVNPNRAHNPLDGIPREQLLNDVEGFATITGLTDQLPILQKGALLAQNPEGFETLEGVTEDEKQALRREVTNKWSHPLPLYMTIIMCSIGAAVQGWDQTGSNGANLSFPVEFGIASPVGHPDHDRDVWLVGVVNAAPYLSSAFIGCWLSDPLNSWFGRRGAIFITAVVLIITPIGSGLTRTWEQLLVTRILMGLGMGAKGSTVAVFAAENSPAAIRGALTMTWQLWVAFGIFIGFAANVVVKDITAVAAWRLQLGSAFIPAVPLAMFVYLCPESPRWLIKKKRYVEAYNSLTRLRYTTLQAARDLYLIHVSIEEESKIVSANSFVRRVIELWAIPRVRRATIAAGVVMLAQQMCGINIISFYSSTIFSEAGYSVNQSLYASLGFGAVNFAFAWPAFFTIDTFGRRSLLLLTFPQMSWSLLVTGLLFLVPEDSISTSTRVGLIALFIYIFTAFYSLGEGPVPFAYAAEVFPLAQREVGMAFAVTVNLFFAGVLTITFPAMIDAMGKVGAFCFYAGLNAIAFFMIFFLVPETKQLTLEELDNVFNIKTSRFIAHEAGVALPHNFKRYILRQKVGDLEPLYLTEQKKDYLNNA